MVVYFLFAFFIGWGILALTVRGNPWLLVISSLVYLALMTRIALLPKQEH